MHEVGVEAALDRAALVAGGAVRRLEGTSLPASVSLKPSKIGSFADSRTEKPTTLSWSGPTALLPPADEQRAVRASTPVSDAATAALILVFMVVSFSRAPHGERLLRNVVKTNAT